MKAAVFSEYSKDPAKVVKITDIAPPKLKSNEVMIRVESAAFNYNDLGLYGASLLKFRYLIFLALILQEP